MRTKRIILRLFSNKTTQSTEFQQYLNKNYFCIEREQVLDKHSLEMKTAFDIFHTPASFSINPEQLGKTFKNYQMQLHPDRLINASEDFVSNSKDLLLRVNQDYKILLDDVKRSFYW